MQCNIIHYLMPLLVSNNENVQLNSIRIIVTIIQANPTAITQEDTSTMAKYLRELTKHGT